MSTLPEGITTQDLIAYAKLRKRLDAILPIFKELEDRVKTAYATANEDIDKQKTILVDEVNMVVTLRPRTALETALFEEKIPFDVEDNKKFYNVKPNPEAVQKAFGKTFYRKERPSFSATFVD